MEYLVKLLQNSEELVKLLKGSFSDEEGKSVEDVHKLLDQRQLIINRVGKPKNEQEQQIAQKIVHYQSEINVLMEKHKGQFDQELKKLKARKVKNQRYSNPYDKVNNDGMFLDRKS
ncbi:hypothetical protein LC040_15010 [Bacillus tianshenii]|nr:hypothetical protein LC040_15010 [Bacillus tianshenii]